MPIDAAAIIAEIDALLEYRAQLRAKSAYNDMSDLKDVVLSELVALLSDAIRRFAPPGSSYAKGLQQLADGYGFGVLHQQQQNLTGLLQGLRRAYAANYLGSVEELVHADVFGDFLEMADYLLDGGYKDAAAVIAGGVLEEGIRKLCAKVGIPVTAPDGRPRKANVMNDELAKAPAYGKLEQKSVTAWLDLRNKAAHGQYTEYDRNQVSAYISGIRDFLIRHPA